MTWSSSPCRSARTASPGSSCWTRTSRSGTMLRCSTSAMSTTSRNGHCCCSPCTRSLSPMSITIEHGGTVLPSVTVDAYNAELRDPEGFTGDRASNRAFRALLDEVRQKLGAAGWDPLGETPSAQMKKSEMDRRLAQGSPVEAGTMLAGIEAFAAEFASVISRFLKLKAWHDTQRIVIGGGLRGSRVGEL